MSKMDAQAVEFVVADSPAPAAGAGPGPGNPRPYWARAMGHKHSSMMHVGLSVLSFNRLYPWLVKWLHFEGCSRGWEQTWGRPRRWWCRTRAHARWL